MWPLINMRLMLVDLSKEQSISRLVSAKLSRPDKWDFSFWEASETQADSRPYRALIYTDKRLFIYANTGSRLLLCILNGNKG